jgi:hypothetical protein
MLWVAEEGIILIPEGREGRGWSCFAVELGKVIAFFEASIGSGLVPPSSVLKESRNLVEPWLVQSSAITRGSRSFSKVDAPSYAEVLCSTVSFSEVEKMMM